MFTIKDTYDNSHYTLDDIYVLWRSTDHGDGIVVIDEELNVKIVPSNYPVNLVAERTDKKYRIKSFHLGNHIQVDMSLYPSTNIWNMTLTVHEDYYTLSFKLSGYGSYNDIGLFVDDANELASLIRNWIDIVPKLQEILKREIDIVHKKQRIEEQRIAHLDLTIEKVIKLFGISRKRVYREQLAALITNQSYSLRNSDKWDIQRDFTKVNLAAVENGNLILTDYAKSIIKEYYHDYNDPS